MGKRLRRNGGAAVQLVAVRRDNWFRLGLAQASCATCRQVQVPAEVPLVLLVSDGVSDQVPATVIVLFWAELRAAPVRDAAAR